MTETENTPTVTVTVSAEHLARLIDFPGFEEFMGEGKLAVRADDSEHSDDLLGQYLEFRIEDALARSGDIVYDAVQVLKREGFDVTTRDEDACSAPEGPDVSCDGQYCACYNTGPYWYRITGAEERRVTVYASNDGPEAGATWFTDEGPESGGPENIDGTTFTRGHTAEREALVRELRGLLG